MEYKFGTIEYEVKNCLEIMLRMDKQFDLLQRVIVSGSLGDNNVARLTRLLAGNAKSIFPELYERTVHNYVELKTSNLPRLIKH